MAQAILTAALSPDEAPAPDTQPPPDVAARLLLDGVFAAIDLDALALERDEEIEPPPYAALFSTAGDFAFYEFQDGRKLLRLDNFRVTNGPNLHVYLSPNPAPLTFDDLGFYFDAGQLLGNTGPQNYDIPASLNLGDFASVVIVCLDYQFIYGVAQF
ncbi:DM13 domain-containing protein [bacterium]|nr:DM13 domain-containing protein [bacterium]